MRRWGVLRRQQGAGPALAGSAGAGATGGCPARAGHRVCGTPACTGPPPALGLGTQLVPETAAPVETLYRGPASRGNNVVAGHPRRGRDPGVTAALAQSRRVLELRARGIAAGWAACR